MASTPAQKLAKMRYYEKTYEKIGFDVKKGKRDYYKQEAAKRGLSLAQLIQKSVEKFIDDNPVTE